jgi:glycosyltransferase involved in cell wall biosynthesis
VLVSSPAFAPLIGGLETFVEQLASELHGRGHEVTVLTSTPGPEADRHPFRVVRCPGLLATLRWMRWCEIFFQANVSLRNAWPRLVLRRPWVVSHQSWYRRPDGRIAWQDRLNRLCLRFATSVAASQALADDLEVPSVVVPNAYRDRLFGLRPEVTRDKDLVFVGRLVTDKGVDLLLEALALPPLRLERPGLTIVGDGPEAEALRRQAVRLGLADRVTFAGTRTGEELVATLNAHRVLVVPSRYHEPFGIVALEGIACGCRIVASRGGGLSEASGPGGVTFPNGDVAALAAALVTALREEAPGTSRVLEQERLAHLERHGGASMVESYLAIFAEARR